MNFISLKNSVLEQNLEIDCGEEDDAGELKEEDIEEKTFFYDNKVDSRSR